MHFQFSSVPQNTCIPFLESYINLITTLSFSLLLYHTFLLLSLTLPILFLIPVPYPLPIFLLDWESIHFLFYTLLFFSLSLCLILYQFQIKCKHCIENKRPLIKLFHISHCMVISMINLVLTLLKCKSYPIWIWATIF